MEADTELELPEIRGDCLELDIEFEATDAAEFGLILRRSPDGAEQTRVSFTRDPSSVRIDFGKSSRRSDLDYLQGRAVQEAPFQLGLKTMLHLRVFLDRSVMEVFAGRQRYLVQRIYPGPGCDGCETLQPGWQHVCPAFKSMAHGTGPLTDGRPNILLIVTDQQSAFMLGCAGNRHVRTPAMDRIAARGVRFARTWCSNPMCLPSRFSLVTGRLGSDFGIRHNDDGQRADIPDAVRGATAGWLLRRAGYETAWGGKAHLPAGWTPEALGFETITRDERDGLAAVCADFVGRKRQRPFFLMASFINPHDICFMAIRDHADDERRRQLARKNPDALRELDAALQLPPGMDREAFSPGTVRRCQPTLKSSRTSRKPFV